MLYDQTVLSCLSADGPSKTIHEIYIELRERDRASMGRFKRFVMGIIPYDSNTSTNDKVTIGNITSTLRRLRLLGVVERDRRQGRCDRWKLPETAPVQQNSCDQQSAIAVRTEAA